MVETGLLLHADTCLVCILAVSCHPGLPNGHPPKKQKKSKKDDELPSFESMLDGSGGGNGVAGATAQQQQRSSGLNSSSAGAQEAALQLLQSLLQVTASCLLATFALSAQMCMDRVQS